MISVSMAEETTSPSSVGVESVVPPSPPLTVESDLEDAQPAAAAAAERPETSSVSPEAASVGDDSARTFISTPAAAVEEKRKKSVVDMSGEELLGDPWRDTGGRSMKMTCYTFKQPNETLGKLDRYPSFLNSRRSVNMSACSSPNVFRTLQKSPSRKAHTEETYPALDPQVVDTITELDQHRKKCEKEGNYLEANAAVAKLHKLKTAEDEKRRTAMLERHMREREMAKKAYVTELEERNRLWDDKLKNFHREVMEHAGQLKRQHTAALQAFRAKMASKTPSKPQWSRELLKLRKVQECLGKQGKYMEAQELKRQADQMEQDELHATLQAYQNEMAVKEQSMRSKQQVELEVLLQRAAQARDELRRNKEQDLDRCHQRHKNVVRELKVIHSQESFRFDHYLGKRTDDKRASLRKSISASGRGRPGLNFEDADASLVGSD